jgi:predicted nucleotidyltransferase
MEGLDEQVQHAVVDALRDSGAVFGFIHGSTARGTARAGSDIDVVGL